MTHPLLVHPPLVEIIAEVRLEDDGAPSKGVGVQFTMPDDAKFVSFGIAVGHQGYTNLERLVPPGFPVPHGAVIYRYRRPNAEEPTLYQLGADVFTANALPPYDSWTSFRPHVVSGLEAAFAVGVLTKGRRVRASLKYVDAFSGESLLGRTPSVFLQDLLGLNYSMPKCMATDREPRTLRFSTESYCAEDAIFALEAGAGKKDQADAVILNTTASSSLRAETVESILEKLDVLQALLHDAFLELIERFPGDPSS
ncbi:TIGR04255 family protein [Luteimonas sp. RD2P54]|uniref:TIGR04255 family protein n=1 Tax=Luteimonas endophytica TaxID=3042023 RepID=A0ABT6JEF5_9GAMM|nr:TIGR04255 family protein [Luteimonas endophytica]MDH5824945.1 TIGR04255 family protein [Luteimonas endophytica]